MFDPGLIILAVGTLSAGGAATCAVQAVKAHMEVNLHTNISEALKTVYDSVVNEEVPSDLSATLDRLRERE